MGLEEYIYAEARYHMLTQSNPVEARELLVLPPGESATIRFQAMRPGVYVYHCATPMVSMHIASGMYGLNSKCRTLPRR